MGSINKVILVGRLGRDPEIKSLANGDRVANLRLATSETWRDKATGERKEKTEWHTVAVFNDALVKVLDAHAKKGSMLGVEGSLQTRKWQDSSGADRYSTEVVVSRFRGEITLLGGGSSEGVSDAGSGSSHG